ncbi:MULTISPECIES: hypothetical protein [Methylomonas]|uniref:hypothetical protein n=1 Tax=Methylomonas TaxID=416 RepID=UPI0012321235|nr:hypothetical protein [Methylomonas rhizoryzae]
MHPIDHFSLENHPGPYQTWPSTSRLYFAGLDTGVSLPGYFIEAQYQCDAGYLLITSYDCPFEESNEFLLLGTRFEALASKRLIVPNQSFLLNAHWPVSPTELALHYYEELFYRLTIVRLSNRPNAGYGLKLFKVEDVAGDVRALASLAALRQRLQANR